MRVFDMLYFFQ